MIIKRLLEKNISELSKHFPSIAILGPRQVGKTTLVKKLRKDFFKETVYLDLERLSDKAKLDNPEIYFNENREKCVIIDEIQKMSNLFPLLRSVIDEYRIPARFILLGSASPEILKRSSETLAGRIVYKELYPINYFEIETQISQNIHWLRGGFPEPLTINIDNLRWEWYESYIKTIIERELPGLGLNTSPNLLFQFFQIISSLQGNILNMSTISKLLSVSVNTIKNYLFYLENGFFVRILQPYYINIKKRIVKSPKIYIRDSGLLHFLYKLRNVNDILGHYILGASWEGYVIEQIINLVGTLYDYYFYRTQDGTECDLIIVDNIKPIFAIEIKFTSSPKKSKSFCNCINDLNTEANFIVVPECEDSYAIDKNIRVCDLKYILHHLQQKLLSKFE